MSLRMRVAGPIAPVVRAAARYELVDFVSREPTLEDVFLAQYGAHDGRCEHDARSARARPMPWSRVMGLRSIYAKTVRDSRRAALIVGAWPGCSCSRPARHTASSSARRPSPAVHRGT